MSEQLSMGIGTEPAPADKAPDLDGEFSAFWAAYPKRPNNPKHPARLKWALVRRDTSAAEIMAGLARYEFSADPRLRPMARTWLFQRRWECVNDDLTVDSFGVDEWLEALPPEAGLSAHTYDAEDLRAVLIATGWPADWRGPLDVLAAWMRDGYSPDSVAKVIAGAVSEFGSRPTLSAFDKRVRYRAERIIES